MDDTFVMTQSIIANLRKALPAVTKDVTLFMATQDLANYNRAAHGRTIIAYRQWTDEGLVNLKADVTLKPGTFRFEFGVGPTTSPEPPEPPDPPTPPRGNKFA